MGSALRSPEKSHLLEMWASTSFPHLFERGRTSGRLAGRVALYGVSSGIDRMVGLVLTPVIAKLLGPGDLGLYRILVTTAGIVAGLWGLNVRSALIALGSRSTGRDELASLVQTGVVLSAAGLVASALLAVVVTLAVPQWSPSVIWCIWYASIAVVIGALANAFPTAFQQARFVVSYTALVRGLGLAVAVVVLVASRSTVLAVVALSTPEVLIGAWVISKVWRELECRSSRATLTVRRILRVSVPLLFAGYGEFALRSLDSYLVLAFLGVSWVGIYGMVYSITSVVAMLKPALSNAMLPGLAAAEARGEDWTASYGYSMWRIIGVTLVVLTPIAVVGPALIIPLSSRAFVPGVVCFPWVLSAFGVTILAAGPEAYLTMMGRARHVGAAYAAGAVLNLLLNLWAIPRFGILGAAVTTCASFASTTGLLGWGAWVPVVNAARPRMFAGLAGLTAVLAAALTAGLRFFESLGIAAILAAALGGLAALVAGSGGLLDLRSTAAARALSNVGHWRERMSRP